MSAEKTVGFPVGSLGLQRDSKSLLNNAAESWPANRGSRCAALLQ